MSRKPIVAAYFLLLLWGGMSVTYYVSGIAALRQQWFSGQPHVRPPFQIYNDKSLHGLTQEAKQAGLSEGDVLEMIDGSTFTGSAQLMDDLWHARLGDVMTVTVRRQDGQAKRAEIRLKREKGPGLTAGELIAYLTPVLCVQLLGLIVGFWAVAARPRDMNAWLVLVLLTFPEVAFGNLNPTWRHGTWFVIFEIWHIFVQMMAFPALLWFGFFFPERSRIDRHLPWLKWAIFVMQAYSLASVLWFRYLQRFDATKLLPLLRLQFWTDRVTSWVQVACVLLFLIAIVDKLRFTSLPDARRRLRVLAVGSGVSFGALLLILGLLPQLGYSLRDPWLFVGIAASFMALFPLTLAYVLVVQRAMDLRVLLRIGTKYVLAKAALLVIELTIAAFVLLGFVAPMIEHKQHRVLTLILLAVFSAALFRLSTVRNGLSSRWQTWLDRKFFREAYNADIVLSALSEEVRGYVDKGPLIETVSRRISDVLHVEQVAIWLRAADGFHLEQVSGFNVLEQVVLPETSETVQNLTRTNRPAKIYRERPEEWLTHASPQERLALDQMQAELLLALPGRSQLMGVMALGRKRSEEPYTPTDLRLLQLVATQTGLALEMSELARLLAREAVHREMAHREMEIAREVQQRLFPQQLPIMRGIDLAGMCRPALDVGGDYYDLIEFDDGRLGLAIGDVSGKGISAALLMASLRAVLRAMALDGPSDLAKMMQKVNRLIFEASSNSRYATFFFAVYNPDTSELSYTNAGHNPPILLGGGAKVENAMRLEAGGLVIGLLRHADYEQRMVRLKPGDVLVAYTDGISEAMTADGEEWGEERLLDTVRATQHNSAAEILQRVFQSTDEFTTGASQHDDMTMLVMKIYDESLTMSRT